MTIPWIFPGLIPPIDLGITVGSGIAAAAFLLLALRLGKVARANRRLEAQAESLARELEKTSRTLREALMAIENENFTDPLTDLHNRRYLSAVIQADVAKVLQAYRDPGSGAPESRDLVFLMVDLDHFSLVNEYHGSAAGDQMLVAVARTLRRIFHESDAVIRWGGEEFLVVVRDATRSRASEMAERIRRAMADERLETPKGEILQWTCSVGFAVFPFQAEDHSWMGWDRVVEVSGACLAVAKKSGRNAWVGVQAREGLEGARHGARIPRELCQLVDEGVLEVLSNREDPFGKIKKVGEILG